MRRPIVDCCSDVGGTDDVVDAGDVGGTEDVVGIGRIDMSNAL